MRHLLPAAIAAVGALSTAAYATDCNDGSCTGRITSAVAWEDGVELTLLIEDADSECTQENGQTIFALDRREAHYDDFFRMVELATGGGHDVLIDYTLRGGRLCVVIAIGVVIDAPS